MGPRLKTGKVGHGEAATRGTAASDDPQARHGARKGSGESARIQTQGEDADSALRISARRGGSGSGE